MGEWPVSCLDLEPRKQRTANMSESQQHLLGHAAIFPRIVAVAELSKLAIMFLGFGAVGCASMLVAAVWLFRFLLLNQPPWPGGQ